MYGEGHKPSYTYKQMYNECKFGEWRSYHYIFAIIAQTYFGILYKIYKFYHILI